MNSTKETSSRSVLLTTLFSFKPEQMSFCVTQPNNWHRQYCTMMIPAEASTKQVLSLAEIDEIVVIGEPNAAFPEEMGKPIRLIDFEDTLRNKDGNRSPYGFFCYRMQQYLKNKDKEFEERIDSIPKERQAELEKLLRDRYMQSSEAQKVYGIDRYFDALQANSEMTEKEENCLEKLELSPGEKSWLLSKCYSLMTDSLKCIALDKNLDVKVRFVASSADVMLSTDNITHIVDAVADGYKSVHLIADLHSLNLIDAYSILSTMNMFESVYKDGLIVDSLLCIDYTSLAEKPAVVLFDWSERYSIYELVAAVDTFKKYGKADPLDKYWKEHGEKNPKIDKIIYAMKSIDAGISLCDISEIEYGLKQIKTALNDYIQAENEDGENNGFVSKVISILMYGLFTDYGELITSENPTLLELLKWCVGKKLYQQAMTLVEARFPGYLARSGIFYYCNDEEESKKVMDVLTHAYYNDPPFIRYQYNDIDHYMVKSYGRSIMKKNGGTDEKAVNYAEFMRERVLMKRAEKAGEDYKIDTSLLDKRAMEESKTQILGAYSLIEDTDFLKDLLATYYSIGNIRNSINHAAAESEMDFSDSREVGESLRLRKIERIMSHFIKQLERATDEIEGKANPSYRIEGTVFRAYANEHKPPKPYKDKKGSDSPKDKEYAKEKTGSPKDIEDSKDKSGSNGPKIIENIRNIFKNKK